MVWSTFGANTGKRRALPETPQNDAITVLLEGNRDSNEILSKSVILRQWHARSKNTLDYNC